MTLSAAKRRGPYEILAAIGAGGMGEVYRARERLKRDVAVKVLPASFAIFPVVHPSGEAYAYRFVRAPGDLYVMDGVR